MNPTEKQYEYDVALSFAGEDRDYVEAVANELRNRDVVVFYDKFFQTDLAGKNLHDHLTWLYFEGAELSVVFISEHYPIKQWPNNVERPAVFARQMSQESPCLIPYRFDDTVIKGLLPTIGYLSHLSPEALASLIVEKLHMNRGDDESPPKGNHVRAHFKSLTTLDSTALADSMVQFRTWAPTQLHSVPVHVRLPNRIRQWIEYCEEVVDSSVYRDTYAQTQESFTNFVLEAKGAAQAIGQGIAHCIYALKLDDSEGVQVLIDQYARMKAVGLIREILDHRLRGMEDAEWFKHFRLFERHTVRHPSDDLAYVRVVDGEEPLYWIDADLSDGTRSTDFRRERVYLPIQMVIDDSIGKLSREQFLRVVAPQLVDRELGSSKSSWIGHFAQYPDRARFTLRGEWITETEHYSQVSTSNASGAAAMASVRRALQYIDRITADDPKRDLARMSIESRLCGFGGNIRELIRRIRSDEDGDAQS